MCPLHATHSCFWRDALLTRLQRSLAQASSTGLSHIQALTGLGGIGKTQLAVEYAYRYRQNYRAVLWARAETTDQLRASYSEIAGLLNLPERDMPEQEVAISATRRWLQSHRDWLLILDNAYELDLLPPFLPPVTSGHVLITTRATALRRFGIATPFTVESFADESGALLLLRRAGLLPPDSELSQADPQDQILAQEITQELGGLPLALDQAAAYLEATGTDLAAYQQIYQHHQAELLQERRGRELDHPEPVATTWLLSFERVEVRSPAAAELLRLCAFLAPDALGEELLVQGKELLGPVLSAAVANRYRLEQAFEALRAYSLITRDPAQKTLTTHRLVQAVMRETLAEEQRQQWRQRAILLMEVAFPQVRFDTWATCERYLSHALQCVQYEDAEQAAQEALVRLLNRVGQYLTARARYQEAEPLLQRALALAQRVWGEMHPQTAASLSALASLSERQGKYAQAEQLYDRALAIRENYVGSEQAETASSLNQLALLYAREGKYAEAEPLLERALSLREKLLGAMHPATATSLNTLAYLYEQQGKYEQAEPLYRRALFIREQQLGPDHPATATSLNNLALLYGRQEKYEEAEALLQRVLNIREQQLGETHPRTAMSLNNLAYLYRNQGKYEQAEPLYCRALAIREQQLGEMHPETASSLNNLAMLYEKQGKYAQAEMLLQRALAIREQMLGETHPETATTLHNLAVVYERQERYSEAERLSRRVLSIREQQLGEHHPDTQATRTHLATLVPHMKPDDDHRENE